MHDIIIEIRQKTCVHVHLKNKHTRVEMETIVSLYREYMKCEEGVWGASPPPPRSQRNEKKSNKMEASPFR